MGIPPNLHRKFWDFSRSPLEEALAESIAGQSVPFHNAVNTDCAPTTDGDPDFSSLPDGTDMLPLTCNSPDTGAGA